MKTLTKFLAILSFINLVIIGTINICLGETGENVFYAMVTFLGCALCHVLWLCLEDSRTYTDVPNPYQENKKNNILNIISDDDNYDYENYPHYKTK